MVGIVTFAAVLAGPGAAGGQAVIGGEWRADVDAFARAVVDRGLTPGMSVAVAVGDWVVWSEGFGAADRDSGRAVTPETPFYIASTTKSLTATAVVLAAHDGALELDAPMVRYLPDAALPEGVEPSAITVHHLLTLTHGLSGSGPIVTRTAFTGDFTRPELLELLRHHEDTGDRGSFSYNNLGYNLLGMILEAAYPEESWKEIVNRLVLEPLGMEATTAYLSSVPPDRIALPHERFADGFARIPLAKTDANLHAAGGHVATAADLARYVAAHQSRGTVEGEALLPAEPLATTHELHVEQDRDFGPYHRFGWGYGWDLGTYEGETLLHRFGGFAGYRSHVSFMPDHRLGVVVLVNGDATASPTADLVANYAYERLLGRPDLESRFEARLDSVVAGGARFDEQVAEHLEERAARAAPLPHPLEAYAGVYESPVLGRMEWRVIAGGLEMRIGVIRSRAEVYDASNDQLRIDVAGTGRVVEFEFGPRGPARSARVDGVEFRRVEDGDGGPG